MTPPYLFRLVCLSLASFFVVNVAVEMAVSLIAPAAIRFAGRIDARAAARFLLVLRLAPAGIALIAVAGLCVPSYLWFEPRAAEEQLGWWCLAAAVLGAALWVISISSALHGIAESLRVARRWRGQGHELPRSGQPTPVWVMETACACVALTGILRPRIFVSGGVLGALGDEELAATLRHERAHQVSGDNLKRLFILLAPGVFPFLRGLENLERAWLRFTEWAADDRAVAGDARCALALATALVRVARIGPPVERSALTTSLLSQSLDLAARVDRLLRVRPVPAGRGWVVELGVVLGIFMPLLLLQPATLRAVHELLERLML